MKLLVYIRSWKSTLLGMISIALSILQGKIGNYKSLSDALHDPTVQVLILVGLIGFVTKDANVSGQPTPPVQIKEVK